MAPGAETVEHAGLGSPEFFVDPYPVYSSLRDHSPCYWSPRYRSWILTRYEDVAAMLLDPRLSAVRKTAIARMPSSVQAELSEISGFFGRWLMFMDGPAHSRVRKAAQRHFTPSALISFEPMVQGVVAGVVSRLAEQCSFDLLRDFARPIASQILLDFIGVDNSSSADVDRWAHSFLDFLIMGAPDEELAHRAQDNLREILARLRAAGDRRPHGGRSLLAALLADAQRDHALTERDAIELCANILVDGFDPLANAIANATAALMRISHAWSSVASNGLTARQCHELVRHQSPFQYIARYSKDQIALHGATIAASDRVMLFVGSANRDGSVFPDGDTLLLTRDAARHVAFGHGVHACLGGALALLTIRTAVPALARGLSHDLHLDGSVDGSAVRWRESIAVRELVSSRVVLRNRDFVARRG